MICSARRVVLRAGRSPLLFDHGDHGDRGEWCAGGRLAEQREEEEEEEAVGAYVLRPPRPPPRRYLREHRLAHARRRRAPARPPAPQCGGDCEGYRPDRHGTKRGGGHRRARRGGPPGSASPRYKRPRGAR